MDLTSKTIVITGGAGFLGTHLVRQLRERGCQYVVVPRSSEYDLRKSTHVDRLFEDAEPEVVIHLAGTVGGIGMMDERPGEIFYDNTKMGLELIERSREAAVDKFVSIGSVCAYPKHTPLPFKEENLWDGYPDETHAPYGIAKKLPLVQLQAYADQYDFDGIYLLPANLYGPGDDFDPKTSHVIPAIIRKYHQAIEDGDRRITAWGTGEPTRDFLYVKDAATGVIQATVKYDQTKPINLGSGAEISIRELVEKIGDLMDFDGTVEWDTSKPDGQPRRQLDTSRARKGFGWEATKDFETGLERTIEYFHTKIVE